MENVVSKIIFRPGEREQKTVKSICILYFNQNHLNFDFNFTKFKMCVNIQDKYSSNESIQMHNPVYHAGSSGVRAEKTVLIHSEKSSGILGPAFSEVTSASVGVSIEVFDLFT